MAVVDKAESDVVPELGVPLFGLNLFKKGDAAI